MSRLIVLGTSTAGRTPPAVEVVARELTRQIREAISRGTWLSAQSHS